MNGFVYKKHPHAVPSGDGCRRPGHDDPRHRYRIVVGLVVVGGIVLIQRMSARRLAA
ncbi:MAG: hypothetical protein ACLSHO_05685 [Dysosmobacter sp.]